MPSSIFSDSSSHSGKEGKTRSTPKIKSNLANIQKFNAVECGEEGLELLVTIISMTTTLKGKDRLYVTALISDGENFAMLDTSCDDYDRFTVIANMAEYQNQTYMLRNISAWAYPKKLNLGNMDVGFLYSNRSTIVEVTDKELLIKDCFHKYIPHLKFFLPDNQKVKRVKELDVKMLKKPTKVSIAPQVKGVTQEVKTLNDQRDVILTKIQIVMDESNDELEIACWGMSGVHLGKLLEKYVGSSVGFANLDASTWYGKSYIGINLSFGQESKIRLPAAKNSSTKRLAHAKLPFPPTSILEIGGYEGRTQLDLTLQLVKSAEEVEDDRWFAIGGDSNRHKIQLHFNFDVQNLSKGDTITVKKGTLAQSGKVINLTIENSEDFELVARSLFEKLDLNNLVWCGTKVKQESIPDSEMTTPKSTASTRATRSDSTSPKSVML